jgi:hypothetical protein
MMEMTMVKISITMDEAVLKQLHSMVKSRFIPAEVKPSRKPWRIKLERIRKTRLARECATPDPDYERSFSEEGFSVEIDGWPEY